MAETEWVSPYLDRLGESVDPPAFSNGTEHRMWEANYCNNCWHDRKAREGKYEDGCELIAMAFAGLKVDQWVYTDRMWPAHVHCLKFTPDDDGPDAGPPVPKPPPPGQACIFDPSTYDWDNLPDPACSQQAPARQKVPT